MLRGMTGSLIDSNFPGSVVACGKLDLFSSSAPSKQSAKVVQVTACDMIVPGDALNPVW